MDTNKIILSVAALVALCLAFGLGVFVGTKRADFSFRWAQQYHHNFGGPSGGFLNQISGSDFANPNGVFGQIIKIDGQIITVESADKAEKSILVSDKTIIVMQRKNIKISDLDIDDNVVVIGSPNDNGQIQAKLIRIMPPLPQHTSSDVKP